MGHELNDDLHEIAPLAGKNSDFGEPAEYAAGRDDVTPLAGWL